MALLIAEHSFDPPLTEEQHVAIVTRLTPCLEAHGARWVRSYLSSDHRRMVCEFDAADAEAVREAHRAADAPFDQVWTGVVFKSTDA